MEQFGTEPEEEREEKIRIILLSEKDMTADAAFDKALTSENARIAAHASRCYANKPLKLY